MIKDTRQEFTRIPTVTSGTFKTRVLEGMGPIVVEFMTYGCAHCRTIEPVLQQAAALLESTEQIVRVNVAVERDLANSYQIQGTPTLVMFLNARQVGRVEGPHPVLSSVLAAVTEPFKR
jgi:thioredoxin 1